MRRTILCLTTLTALALLASCAGGTGKEDATVRMHVADDPTVSFAIRVQTGSQDDPDGKEGLAYLTGQMIADASTTENSYEAILEKLYPMAASYGVRVDREMTTLTGRVHKDNLDAYVTLLTDALLEPAFNEDDFNRIKGDTLNYLEKSLRYASDEELGKAALMHFVFEGSGYAHPPEGTVAGLKSITLDDVRSFYASRYTADNVVVALGGGFDEALVDRMEQARKALPAGTPEPTPPPVWAEIDGRQVLLVDKEGADASISFGFPVGVHRGEREFYALWVANSWLGEHRNSSSHLYQVIREARGMNYGDYSYIEAFPEGGQRSFPPSHVGRRQQLFEVWIRTLPNPDAIFALRAALRELDRLVNEGMSEEDFELTRTFLSKYVLQFAKTTQERLGYAVDDRFYGIDGPGHLARFRQVLPELTVEEVNAAVKKHLQTDRMKIAIVTGDAETLKETLIGGAATPKTYASKKSDEILEEDEEIAAFPLRIAEGGVRVLPVAEIFEE